MELEQVIRERRSIKGYDESYKLDDDDLRRLFELVVLSPSSFNLQHWRFVVVRNRRRKNLLQEAAHDQKHVGQASAVIVVCGKLNAHMDAPQILSQAQPEVRQRLLPKIERFYEGRAQLQRDEAIRSAALASMTLMLVAQSAGLVTCPIIGFDPDQVIRIVRLDPMHVPVMLMTIGKPNGTAIRATTRHPVERVVRLERLDGAELGTKPRRRQRSYLRSEVGDYSAAPAS